MDENLNKNRIWELDFLRGVALLLMVYFHVIFDMKDIYNYNVVYDSGINFYIGRSSAILFIFIAGISSSLSRNNVKRGLKIFGLAMLITLVTHLYDRNLGIKFGIFHFLGLSMLLYPLLRKLPTHLLFLLGIAILALGQVFRRITTTSDLLFPIGLPSENFVSSDYYSFVPWLGIFILGIIAARLLYKDKKSLFRFSPAPNPISFAGRHTLVVYLIHQPLIVALFTLARVLGNI